MPTSTRLFSSLALVLAATSAVACGSSAAKDDPSSPGANVPVPSRDDAGNPTPGPKAPPVMGTPDASEFNETLGVFVTPSGKPGADGTRERPLDTIQAGIEKGKAVGKRVYVCAGTYREALTLADSISVIGGLDCSNAMGWKAGSAKSRVEAAASPAMRAKDIMSATRIEGLDVVAPDVTEPSASSIGLLADHSAGLTLARSIITAGNAANGVDGIEGTQLTLDAAAAKGGISPPDAKCDDATCTRAAAGSFFAWKKPVGVNGGISVCSGAPGHDGQSGGAGGSGGLLEPAPSSPTQGWNYYFGSASFAPALGEARSTLPAAAGVDGANAAAIGALTPDGYAVANGGSGTNGAGGFGGSGGRGFAPRITSVNIPADQVWRGIGGSGGGAGGCPGLAGTAGTGGGASIALALIDSPLVIDGSQLVSRKGGTGGRGTFGGEATAGGAAGLSLSDFPTGSGAPGGRGGAPGVSTNGSSGPSIGILSAGAAPAISNDTTLTTGAGGAAIPAASRPDPVGVIRTIPATPAGLSKDKHSL